ncbi:hypothetical protein [Aerosakkonema funiforme]|uniref:hypothetical protein n=1 Tax=Aerosakkonema funiforme TaxID=1246630 RepID=UPI0018EFF1C7|nr:hypothetical protein [Aerosakkonema funiforme]
MTASVENILNSFELLSKSEKRQIASEILKRTLSFDFPSLTDEELAESAEEIFLQLDKREIAGRWIITIQPKTNTTAITRSHDAFLKGYAPEDEGLYDDYPTG